MGLYIDHNWDISVLRISELVFWDITVVVWKLLWRRMRVYNGSLMVVEWINLVGSKPKKSGDLVEDDQLWTGNQIRRYGDIVNVNVHKRCLIIIFLNYNNQHSLYIYIIMKKQLYHQIVNEWCFINKVYSIWTPSHSWPAFPGWRNSRQ